ncbi:uncharacterized protein BT62DRAFT_1079158 [Guyanagaster necrorhizus]|uniref:DUF6534 domain-containing protein n=1 Tax=Guyanagaster necrorhizus TaxID=856835 RepID=A0A9P8AP39_9AGAR|nr:uncharacterized protein BT62DRAFT_1079158 [Guyanagaster necrorhizus MCA 3950]KAG7442550.1 hypothetical protein BT62DRAFT_1079158 [Guyanagaster necrorhizus MCA 3950]
MPSSFAAEAALALPSLGSTLGVMSVGVTIALILYGTANLQTIIYFKEYPNDWWFYRLSVATIWVLDTLHVAFSTHALYYYTINSFGDYLALLNFVWSFKLSLVLYNMIVFCVHIIYCVRLWMLGRYFHRAVPWFITFIVACICAASIVFCHDVYTISYIIEIDKISATIEGGLIITATVDMIISFALCYYILKARTFVGVSSMNLKLVALMWFILISGLGTSALVLASLITFLAFPRTLIFMSIGIVVPKLYINSLLAMFNTRERSRRQEPFGSVSLPTFRVQGEENMTGTVPLSIISGAQTCDESILDISKSEHHFYTRSESD